MASLCYNNNIVLIIIVPVSITAILYYSSTTYSVTAKCPVVSNYLLYGEYHILRCQHTLTNRSCNKVALSCSKL